MNPGPGYYDNDMKKQASGAKIGKAKRDNVGAWNTPGPGSYGLDESNVKGTKFGTSQRVGMGKTGTPGPGAYDTLGNTRGGVTISGHRGRSKVEDYPGPGSYNPD